MTNPYEIFGRVVRMEVWYKKQMYCWFDTADLPLFSNINSLWVANPARAPRGKFYVISKIWDPVRRQCKAISFHRTILGLTDPKIEGHHKDNDGLNNRRENLEPLPHIKNMRERFPERDWVSYDAAKVEAETYRKERAIAMEVQQRHELTRQGLWKIRMSEPGTGSKIALEYREACSANGVQTLLELQESKPRDGKWGVGRSATLHV